MKILFKFSYIVMKILEFLINFLDLFKITADTHIVACFEPKRRCVLLTTPNGELSIKWKLNNKQVETRHV
ncbi:hypothetical protein D7217_09040 [Legionella pneumophila]|nr:hypothetical protein D7217_09040 [Legionella pneumophila]HAT9856829.1 hypothetical protein [Legionella pneumophila subsp. pneumophila]HAT8674825.1 hypothetical protein [Legionella pneumophila]HAU1022641.1 hypothetical protein [Legionella pneumophila]HAU1059936.1 hypothetical protein [Legionella pneumophila]